MAEGELKLIPERPIVQVIDGDGVFDEKLATEITKWGDFTSKGFDYYVVAILGAQSSGKSTLLNRLFGTTFYEMNAKLGRRQTTLGVWLGRSGTDSQNLLVLDVEGTDSRERGEDHGAFERKTSLFSLALSEVLLINMWTTDVGRHDAANYGLLKIVFELNLQLFQSSNTPKKLLFFVFRDHAQTDEDTPLAALVDTITADMGRIWQGISKPDQYASSKVTDFFDLDFVSLPPKPHMPAKFEEQCRTLRDRFCIQGHPQTIVKTEYQKDVPADGFSQYASSIWQAILANKDLNLPSQKEMLAMFRCEQIMGQALEEYNKGLAPTKDSLDQKTIVDNFGDAIAQLANAATTSYDAQAKRYHPEVSKQKRLALIQKMATDAQPLFQAQLKLLIGVAEKKLTEILKAEISDSEPNRKLVTISRDITMRVLQAFTEQASVCNVPEFEWSTKAVEQDLKQSIEKTLLTVRAAQIELLQHQLAKKLEKAIGTWLMRIIDSNTHPWWDAINENFTKDVAKTRTELSEWLTDFEVPDTEKEAKIAAVDKNSLASLKTVLREKATNASYLMERKFGQKFKQDQDGLPRKWTRADDVRGEFFRARATAEQVLDELTVIRLDKANSAVSWFQTSENGSMKVKDDLDAVPDALAVLPLADVSRLLDQFRDQTQGAYLQAITEQENAASGANTWLIVAIVIAIFGWDDIYWALTNPFMLFFCVVFGVAGFVAFKMNLHTVVLPMVQPVFNAVFNVALTQGQRHLNNYMNTANPPPTGGAATTKAKTD